MELWNSPTSTFAPTPKPNAMSPLAPTYLPANARGVYRPVRAITPQTILPPAEIPTSSPKRVMDPL